MNATPQYPTAVMCACGHTRLSHTDEGCVGCVGPTCDMQITARQIIGAVFRELPNHDQNDPTGYTCTAMPVLEAECAWRGTGLVWTGYSDRDINEICHAVASHVALSLAVAGYLRREPEVTV